MKTSTTSQLSKFAMGDTVMRRGELCTVLKVDYSMYPVSYTVRVNSNGRIVGTEEKYLSPVENAYMDNYSDDDFLANVTTFKGAQAPNEEMETSVDSDEEEDSFLAGVHTFRAAKAPEYEEHVSSDDEDSDSDSFMRGVTTITPARPHGFYPSDSGSPSEEKYDEPKPEVRRYPARRAQQPRHHAHPRYARTAPAYEQRRAAPVHERRRPEDQCQQRRYRRAARPQQVHRQRQHPNNAFFQTGRFFAF